MVRFGPLLRRLRGDRAQREIAADLQMPVTTLSTLENQDSIPRGTVLKKLADYYGVPLAYFYASTATDMKPSGSASAWLRLVHSQSGAEETIATYAPPSYPEETKKQFTKKIRERRNADKTSRSGKT